MLWNVPLPGSCWSARAQLCDGIGLDCGDSFISVYKSSFNPGAYFDVEMQNAKTRARS